MFSIISGTLVGGWSYPSAKKQSVYSTAPVDWATALMYVYYVADSSDVSVDWKVIYVFITSWVLANEKKKKKKEMKNGKNRK